MIPAEVEVAVGALPAGEVGGALLGAWLARVDAAGGAAWLETDEPRTLSFDAKAGFEVRGELELFSVPIWLLGREPRARAR